MATYVLLRKNKESGPFTLANLKSTGLLPDDLVWVEGRSGRWLFPGEINELKTLVGTKEEKPFIDLSFSPPVETKTANKVLSSPLTLAEKKGVFVQMPAHEDQVLEEKNETQIKTLQVPTSASLHPTTLPEEEGTPLAQTRYSKSLDEIKEMYISGLQQQRKHRGLPIKLSPEMKKAALYAGLLITGIIAGVLIHKTARPKFITAQPKTQSLPVQNNVPLNAPLLLNEKKEETGRETVPAAIDVEKPGKEANFLQDKRDKKIDGKTKDPILTDPTNQIKAVEVVNVASSENKASKVGPAEDISSLVSVKSNDYIVASFGGIRNLQLTVKNDSKYLLDQVTVELEYLEPRDELLRTENIYFTSVPANGSQTVSVKKSNRGVKVAYRIIKIESKELTMGG